MAKRMPPTLLCVENDHPVTVQTDPAFVFQLQKGLLLALRERGILNMLQYQKVEEELILQQRKVIHP